MISKTLAVALASALILPSAAVAHPEKSDFDAVEAMKACKMLFADLDGAESNMTKNGWAVPSGDYVSDHKESGGTVLKRDDVTVMFLKGGTDVKGKLGGMCSVYMPGDSIVAATQIAVHLRSPASDFQPAAMGGMHEKVSNSVRFLSDDYIVRVANTDANKDVMLFQYGELRE